MRQKVESFFHQMTDGFVMVAIHFLAALIAVFTGEVVATIQTGMG
jgi:hypothetical protein